MQDKKHLTLAAVQMDVRPAPVAARLARAETLAARAARAGAHLVVLPELFNTGYAYRDENFALAETLAGESAAWMKGASARLGIHLAGSLLLREGQDIYNALLLCAPDGRTWRYDKNYPWGWERAYFRGRRAVSVADTDLGRIGLLLCWDMAHAGLWRQYASQVDLMLACSCPPNIPDPVYHFPNGRQVSAAQLGPVFGSLRHTARQVFVETPRQQTAWLGVPFIGSTACGVLRTPIPNPLGSFLGLVLSAPWLIGLLPNIWQVEVSAPMVQAACIIAADGRQLTSLRNDQAETFTLAEVTLPASRPQPRQPQPRPPVLWLTYFISDCLLTAVSKPVYLRHG